VRVPLQLARGADLQVERARRAVDNTSVVPLKDNRGDIEEAEAHDVLRDQVSVEERIDHLQERACGIVELLHRQDPHEGDVRADIIDAGHGPDDVRNAGGDVHLVVDGGRDGTERKAVADGEIGLVLDDIREGLSAPLRGPVPGGGEERLTGPATLRHEILLVVNTERVNSGANCSQNRRTRRGFGAFCGFSS